MNNTLWTKSLTISISAVALLFSLSAHAAISTKAAPAPKAAASEGDESGLDLTLRSKAAANPVVTGDGSQLTTPASHVYLIDFDTGAVLAQKSGDAKMYPSSMTKMMTLYLTFEKLKQGTLSMTQGFTVSERAWRMQGSKMFVPLGASIPLEDLIRGIAIQSGNDACVTVAEGIAGSEESFATLMNDKAKKLGMTGSHFVNSDGWPNADHYTTAHDLAILANALIHDFPEYYHYFSEREFTYHGIRQYNRNLLLNNPAMMVDGLKTGHTDAAGYGITLSAKEPATNRRLVLVVNGLDSVNDRASEGERILSWGFHSFDDVTLIKAGQEVTKAKVWLGADKQIPLTVASDVKVSMPKIGDHKMKFTAEYEGPLNAPIKKGDVLGKLKITSAAGTNEVPLVAAADDERLSRIGRIPRVIGHWLGSN